MLSVQATGPSGIAGRSAPSLAQAEHKPETEHASIHRLQLTIGLALDRPARPKPATSWLVQS